MWPMILLMSVFWVVIPCLRAGDRNCTILCDMCGQNTIFVIVQIATGITVSKDYEYVHTFNTSAPSLPKRRRPRYLNVTDRRSDGGLVMLQLQAPYRGKYSVFLLEFFTLCQRGSLRIAIVTTCLSVRLSVRLFVRHAPVLCQNEESQRHDFFAIWQLHDSSFLTPNFIAKF